MVATERNATSSGKEPKPELYPFASWLRSEMRRRRVGNNALALRMGVSTSAVSEYQRAIRRPRADAQEKLAAFFKVPLEEVEALLAASKHPVETDRYGTDSGEISHSP